MADIDIPTFEQLTTLMSHLMTNYTSLALTYYTMFYDTEPKDIVISLYDENGELKEYTIPNRAKDFRFCLNGQGNPEGRVSASIGTTYQDTLNGILYIKEVGSSDVTGWVKIGSDSSIEKGYGNPEGFLTREKGTIYENVESAALYIKTTATGNTGWLQISADTTSLANRDLSNLSEEGNDKFLNKSLSNLNTEGQAVIDAKEDVDNKVSEITAQNRTSTTSYTSVKAVYDFVDSEVEQLANRDLSNLTYEGSLKFNGKANTSLDNIDEKGQAKISNLTPYVITDGNLDSNGNLDLIEPTSGTSTTYIFAEAGSYTITVPTAGDYQFEAVSGGAKGTQWDWFYFTGERNKYGVKEGATGAYFKGTLALSAGSHTVTLDRSTGSVTVDDGFILTAGTYSGEGNTSTASGGSLTLDTLISSTTTYNPGSSTVYHVIEGADPTGTTYGPQEATVPADLKGFGFGGAAGFYAKTNEGGSCYAKLTIAGQDSNEVRYNVSSETPLVINTVGGVQKYIYGVNNDQTTDLSNGTYNKFVDENGSELLKNTIYKSLTAPTNPVTNDVWIKLTDPLEVYKYNGTSWEPYTKVCIGSFVVTNGVASNAQNKNILDNGLDVTMYNSQVSSSYVSGSSGYLIYTNGMCIQWGVWVGNIGATTGHTVTLAVPYKDTDYIVKVTSSPSTFITGAYVNNNSSFIHNSRYYDDDLGGTTASARVYWETRGFIS